MSTQPQLPEDMTWPDITLEWWKALSTLPGAEDFTQLQWLYLMDTALLHAAVWSGDFSRHGELGKRLDAFGVTPTAMAKLNGRPKPNSAAVTPPAIKSGSSGEAQGAEIAAKLTPLEAARQRKARKEAAS